MDNVTQPPVNLVLLGSTGSIGRQTLDVVRAMPERFNVLGLAAGRNLDALEAQTREFRPRYIWAASEDESRLGRFGRDSGASVTPMDEMAADPDGDVLVVGTAGRAGLEPTLTSLERGGAVALANKEVVVMAGQLVRDAVDRGGGQLRPVDSEHSAIWQCLWGEDGHEIRRILLTASGGALRHLPAHELADVTPEQALDHPTWNMGDKITIDSATLMNKGMETIEAQVALRRALRTSRDRSARESIVHSLVEFGDGSVKAQLGYPDMKLPIQLALSYPQRLEPTVEPLDLASVGTLNFSRPRPRPLSLPEAGPAGRPGRRHLSRRDGRRRRGAVEAFLERRIAFTEIADYVHQAMDAHRNTSAPDIEAIDAADAWARGFTTGRIAAAV